MKNLLLSLSVAALVATPAFAEGTSVEIKVKANPASAADVIEAHQAVYTAAKAVCAAERFGFSRFNSPKSAEKQCVRDSYAAAVERAREAEIRAFMDDAALEGASFE
ncbi:MAG: hypothetical protein CMK06_02430 [Ponticaulis sp.]|nr:hypothetical protein [Ponticaulis sp.]|tara:strand:- start:446 stop:766 length:321 start_codon:yes stop_codon:yes gene_type:complete